MDLYVELPDGTTKLVPVSLNCSVRAAVQSTALRAGLGPVTNKLSEFSLARNTDSSHSFVDVFWLNPTLPLKDQSSDGAALNLLLFKKYFSANEDLGVLESNAVLLRNVYSQLRRAYVSGLYSCSPSDAALLSALVAKVEFNNTELGPGSLQKTGRLRHILPQMYLGTPGIEQNILKALSTLTHLNERSAREEFVQQVRKSDTFGLSFHTITLEERGGRRDALLGVGPEMISVLERENVKVLMQWKTADLTKHTYDNTTFSMTYGSEVITMVTNNGHMISAFLKGMGKGAATNERAERNNILPNNHTESIGPLEHRISSHIKSVGKKVEQFEAHLKPTRPNVPPRPGPRPPPVRPSRPPLPRKHAALRSTKSVPLTQRDVPQPLPEEGEGAMYETPVQRRQGEGKEGGRGQELQKVTQLPTWEEARYETNEEEPPPKTRPPLPPYPQLKPSPRLPHLLKKKPISNIMSKESGETYLVPSTKKHHHSDSDVTQYITENGTTGEAPTSPIYDEPLQPNEYAEPTVSSPGLSRGRGGRHTAVKRRSQGALNTAAPSTAAPNPIRSPPPSSSAPPPTPTSRTSVAPPTTPAPPPPPPHGPSSKLSIAPVVPSVSHSPPHFPAPPPPIYHKLTPEEDMKEMDDVFEAKDLLMQVKYSRDSNPIYNTIAALKVNSSLTSSNVTFHSVSNTLERRKKKGKSQGGMDPQSKMPSSSPSSYSHLASSENSEILSVLSKDITRRFPLLPPGGKQGEQEGGQREKPQQKTPSPTISPSPPPQRTVITKLGVIENGHATMADETPAKSSPAATNKPRRVSASTAPPPPEGGRPDPSSQEYNRLEHYPKTKPPSPLALQDSTGMADSLHHEYAEVMDLALTGVKAVPKSPNMAQRYGWVVVNSEDGESTGPGTPERRRPLPIMPLIPVDVAGEAGGGAKNGEGEGKGTAPPKPPRVRQRREKVVEKGEGIWRGHKAIAQSDVLRDYSTIMKEFRIFHVKLPTGITHIELANINSEVYKLIKRLCVLLCISDPDKYSLYVEGASLTSVSETTDEEGGEEGGLVRRLRQKSPALMEHFSSSRIFSGPLDQNPNPLCLDPSRSFRSQGVTNSRILALRPQTMLTEKMLRFQIRVPDWVRFHQCWLSVVQGNHPCSLQDAIKLAALQYQAYFLDRTEVNSVIGFCRSSEFLPQEYAAVKGMEEKILAEQQQQLKGYSRRQAQDSYIFTACALPTYNTIFFLCMEVKRRVIQHNKLAPVLIGIRREGVVRADSKTKEILDEWSFQVLKNWGYTDQTFILEFDDRTYPVKTSQGRWMNALVDFHIEAIMGDLTMPPATHQELGYNTSSDDVVPIPHNRDNVNEIYSDLLSVRAQAQQWLESCGKTSPPTSSSPPPASSTETHLPPPPNTQPRTPSPNSTPHPPPTKPGSPPVYEEVDFEPNSHNSTYDVVKNVEGEDAIYDLPPDM